MNLTKRTGRLLKSGMTSHRIGWNFTDGSTATSNASPLPFLVPCIQRRTIFWGRKKDSFAAPKDPMAEEAMKRKPSQQKGLVRGSLSSSSLFEQEAIVGSKPAATDAKGSEAIRNPVVMAAALDPDPSARQRWQRKMVIREIHKRGRLTRTQFIKRQERELKSASHNIKTSVKKLGPLARQIAGKTVEEAIVQMRFSKKKAAKEVKDHLEHARNEAIIKRGMGLGAKDGASINPIMIKTKDGKRVTVTDPTTLYIEQAWVGKGDYGRTPDHRARGQINIMKNPTTRK
jgi:ribosomal protein L22